VKRAPTRAAIARSLRDLQILWARPLDPDPQKQSAITGDTETADEGAKRNETHAHHITIPAELKGPA
jgi:hypothetical protein